MSIFADGDRLIFTDFVDKYLFNNAMSFVPIKC
jgi:hypothetical protein